MQKKEYSTESNSSEWKNKFASEDKKGLIKKLGVWAGIIAVVVVGLVALVMVAQRGGTPQTPVVVENLPAPRESDIIEGNPKAKAILTEYADFQCPACASYNPTVNSLLEQYPQDLMVVFRHFPLRGIHKNAQVSGQAAFAAWKLGKFEEMKDLLYGTQDSWSNLNDPRDVFVGYANEIGLDTEEFESLMNSDDAKRAVLDGEAEAARLGLNSTPSFFVGNKRVFPSTLDDFKALIEEELKISK